MNLNATSLGQALFILALVVIFFTVKFAKGKANNIGLVAIYAVLFKETANKSRNLALN